MKLLPMLVLALLCGCATPYAPYSTWEGGGYSEIQLSERSYLVRFSANEFTPVEQASDFVLMRAAELTMEKGGTNFVVVAIDDQTTVDIDGSSFAGANPGHAYAAGNTNTSRKPNHVMRIEIVPAETSGSIDAAMVYASLSSKYKAGKQGRQNEGKP